MPGRGRSGQNARSGDDEENPNPRGYPASVLEKRKTMTEAECEKMDQDFDRMNRLVKVSAVCLGVMLVFVGLFGGAELTEEQKAEQEKLLAKIQSQLDEAKAQAEAAKAAK